jgi:hypothetical protein
VALGPRVTLVEGIGVGARLGELRAPLELWGFEVLGAALVAYGVGGLSALGNSPPGCESFAGEFRSMSWGRGATWEGKIKNPLRTKKDLF